MSALKGMQVLLAVSRSLCYAQVGYRRTKYSGGDYSLPML